MSIIEKYFPKQNADKLRLVVNFEERVLLRKMNQHIDYHIGYLTGFGLFDKKKIPVLERERDLVGFLNECLSDVAKEGRSNAEISRDMRLIGAGEVIRIYSKLNKQDLRTSLLRSARRAMGQVVMITELEHEAEIDVEWLGEFLNHVSGGIVTSQELQTFVDNPPRPRK